MSNLKNNFTWGEGVSYISKLMCKINLCKNNCNTDMEELNLWTHPLTPHSLSGREALYGSSYIDLQCSNRIWCCLGPLSASGRGYMPPTRSLPCRNSPNNLHAQCTHSRIGASIFPSHCASCNDFANTVLFTHF